jgi:hypothetical protein
VIGLSLALCFWLFTGALLLKLPSSLLLLVCVLYFLLDYSKKARGVYDKRNEYHTRNAPTRQCEMEGDCSQIPEAIDVAGFVADH